MVTTHEDYECLIEQFANGEIDASEFNSRFWELFNRRDFQGTRQEGDILFSYLFGEVESFCGDPDLRSEAFLEIDEVQLKDAATKALEMLKQLRLKPLQESGTNRFTKYAKKLLRRGEQGGQDQT